MVISDANKRLIALYFKIGKIIYENDNLEDKFIENLELVATFFQLILIYFFHFQIHFLHALQFFHSNNIFYYKIIYFINCINIRRYNDNTL